MGDIGEKDHPEKIVRRDLTPFPDDIPKPEQVPAAPVPEETPVPA